MCACIYIYKLYTNTGSHPAHERVYVYTYIYTCGSTQRIMSLLYVNRIPVCAGSLARVSLKNSSRFSPLISVPPLPIVVVALVYFRCLYLELVGSHGILRFFALVREVIITIMRAKSLRGWDLHVIFWTECMCILQLRNTITFLKIR